jgi:hypothetical protein
VTIATATRVAAQRMSAPMRSRPCNSIFAETLPCRTLRSRSRIKAGKSDISPARSTASRF